LNRKTLDGSKFSIGNHRIISNLEIMGDNGKFKVLNLARSGVWERPALCLANRQVLTVKVRFNNLHLLDLRRLCQEFANRVSA